VGATLSEVVVHISLASMSSVRVRGQRIDRVDNTSAKTSAMKRDSRKSKKDDVDSKSIGDNGAVGLTLADHKSDQITLSGDQCGDCGKVVSDDHQGLKCDCCDAWLHSQCENVAADVFYFLADHDDERSISWYCRKCRFMLRSVITSIAKSEDAHKRVEAKMDRILNVVDSKLIDDWPTVEQSHKRLDEKVDALMNNVEEKSVDSVKMHDCIEDVVRTQLLQDKDEEDEIRKRKSSLIVHALKESEAVVAEDRKSDDNKLVEDLFHTLGCDGQSVNILVRLGRRSDSSDAKPRPLKIDMSSEGQKNEVLRRAKNLAKVQEGVFAKVFIHQDLIQSSGRNDKKR